MTTEETTPVYFEPGDTIWPYTGDKILPDGDSLFIVVDGRYRQSFGGGGGRISRETQDEQIAQFSPGGHLILVASSEFPRGNYAGYDGASLRTPVNQFPAVDQYRRKVATFAHQFDSLYTAHSITSNDAQATLEKQGIGMASDAWYRLDTWEAVDPEAIHPSGQSTWRRWQRWVEISVNPCVALCETPTWPRLFAKRANLTLFQAKLDVASINAPNVGVTPWVPGVALSFLSADGVTAENVVAFHKAREAGYNRALDYYDENLLHFR